MSVPIPKFRPMSRLSLSVMSNLQKLSATRSSGRGDLELPAELWVPVHRSRQHEQARERVCWRVRDQGGRPAVLLQAEIGGAEARIRRGTCLDRLVLGDARDRPYDLQPAAVRAGLDQTRS